MQEKFAIKATKTTTTTAITTSNKQSGQIDKSISKYDEMLYIPKSIENRPPATKRYVNNIVVACETTCNFYESNYGRCCPSRCRRSTQNRDDRLVVLKYIKFSQSFKNIFIALIALCLWPWPIGGSIGIGSVGFVHCDNSLNVFSNENFSSTTIEPIEWRRASSTEATMASTETPTPSSSTFATRKISRGITYATESHLAMRLPPISNVLMNTIDKRSNEHNLDKNHEVVDSNGSTLSYERQNQHQQRISIIKTRSEKTNPNASFSLDLFKQQQQQQQNATSERVQNMQSNHTLNRLDEHESNRIPDIMSARESLHHLYHHHSVMKRFRAFVTRRYHFSAKKTKDISKMFRFYTPKTTPTTTTTTPNSRRRPAKTPTPLKYLIYVLSSTDGYNDEHLSDKIGDRKKVEITSRHTKATNDLHLNTDTAISKSINRTNILSRDFHANNSFTANVMGLHLIPGDATAAPTFVTSKSKRSIDLQLKNQPSFKKIQKQPQQKPNSKPTTKQPIDDHFFNSKLKDYYFLYQIDNTSNYNNHFDLLNSPSNYNATSTSTTQIQINKQRIQFSKHHQIDNDATESESLKYNPQQKQQEHEKQTLNFSNNHSNNINRILLTKIASVCLNCVDVTASSTTTDGASHTDNDESGLEANGLSIRLYILPRSSRSIASSTTTVATSIKSRHPQLFRPINDAIYDQTNNNNNVYGDDDDLGWNESILQQSLKNYPRIAGLLGNLSLTKFTNQSNQNLHSNNNDYGDGNISHNLIIDSSGGGGVRKHIDHPTIASTTSAKSFTGHNSSDSISLPLSKSSIKTSKNLTCAMKANCVIEKTVTSIRASDDNAAKHISTNNYSSISTFEHYIRIISSRNTHNNRKNYYAIQTNGNKTKSFNLQQQHKQLTQQEHLKQAKFRRVKKQNQIIKVFATNHILIHNNDTIFDNNNAVMNINIENNKNDSKINQSTRIVGGGANVQANTVDNYKNNCTIKIFNLDRIKIKSKHVKNQNEQHNTAATVTINGNDGVENKKKMKRHFNEKLTTKEQSNVNHIIGEPMVKISHRKINRKLLQNAYETHNKSSRSSTNALNSYLMRLESIKYQILMKLGLKQKPNITTTLPKHVIMETLYRADDNNVPQSNGNWEFHFPRSLILFTFAQKQKKRFLFHR